MTTKHETIQQYVFNCSENGPVQSHCCSSECYLSCRFIYSGSEISLLSICSNPPINITLIATVNRTFYLQSENKAHVAINAMYDSTSSNC